MAINYSYSAEFVPFDKNYLPTSPIFTFAMPGNSQGTYNFISNDGLILTVMHNIIDCVSLYQHTWERSSRSGYYSLVSQHTGEVKSHFIPKTQDEYYPNGVRAIETPHDTIHGITCEKRTNFQADKNSYKIVATGGDGFINFKDQMHMRFMFPEIFQTYVDEKKFNGIGGGRDFALMELTVNNDKKMNRKISHSLPVSCLPISEKGAIVGERVWNLGFPYLINRLGYRPNYSASVSTGVVYSKRNNPNYSEDQLKEFGEELLYASIDIGPGSSGSAVINSKGEIVGVVVMSLDSDQMYEHKPGNASFINSSFIIKVLREKLGHRFVEERILRGCKETQESQQLLKKILAH